MPNEKIQISLGCGARPMPGFVGLDIVDFGWNKIWDATKDRIPFEDSAADLIVMHNFLEHIERRYWIEIFNECWRVLKGQGILEIIVPDAHNTDIAWADPTHKSAFVMGTFKYLTGERPRNAGYGIKPWIVIVARPYAEKDDRVIFAQLRANK